ncbi:asparaginase [Lentzea flaviverrucosa]|uniref:L-asparaginase n=1 Tax=Lentzea flaviverrucosa TaxID=200379 RepID=A0A1H9VMN1_9PSEU|nr:asparaginase [Lentzea flaviverrucosa]RDI23754.1 asparaginase [Lentzea flaviverrucosa]SES22801.1 L-asparaginase [Lentzea flaviverrucosa]
MDSRVAVASLGGTITMTGSGAVTPTLGADDLVRGLEVGEIATLATIPGASLTSATLLEAFDWADKQVSEGARGVVVIQGTDTLEETAYFFDCLWPHDEPIVVTGAMRHPGLPGADGPANLAAAVSVAAAQNSRGRGALLVLNDEIHAARWVRKAHSSLMNAFQSFPGPLGLVVEGAAQYFHPAHRLPALPRPLDVPAVPLIEATVDDDGAILDWLDVKGTVVAATGAGHVSAGMAEAISRARFPVVVATRTGAGTTFRNTYGFVGSESDLIERGVVMAGWLCPRKARVLLRLALGAMQPIGDVFAARGAIF